MIEAKELKAATNNELENLVRLLDDEDENIYTNIKERFLSHGYESITYLKNCLHSDNNLLKSRANEIISILKFEEIDTGFKKLSYRNENDILEEAIFLIASFGYPEVKMESYKREIDNMASDIQLKLLKRNNNVSQIKPLDILNTINAYLFNEKKFSGNSESYYDPNNSYLNKVLDSKRGIPITLSIIYLLISKRLKLPMTGVNLPGHFIVKYEDQNGEYFIDPFNKGIVISMKEAEEFVKKIGMSKADLSSISYLKKSTDREIVLRVLRNLMEIYKEKSDKFRSSQLEKLMDSLTG